MSATSRSRNRPGAPTPAPPDPAPDASVAEGERTTGTFRGPSWRRKAPLWHALAEVAIKVTALLAIVAIVLIFVFIGLEAAPILWSKVVHAEVTPKALWVQQSWDGAPPRWSWQPAGDVPKYSVVPLVIGSLKITLVAVAIGAPLGILAAIYASQVAPRWLRELLKPTVELLAGIPSVVLGVFALLLMASWFQRSFGFEHRLNAVVAGCALSLTIVPLVFTLAEDALSAVPKELSDSSLALGASRMHTVRHVIVPAALPGIAAGVVLGFGRAVGETMIVLMASGNAALVEWTLGHSTRTITATVAQEMAEVVHGSPHYVVLFVLGATLLLFTFVTNLAAYRVVEHFRRKRGGA